MHDPLHSALERIRAGGLVAYPTETVWGLAADATSDAALARLRAFKGRTEEHPIAILVDGIDALGPLDFEFGPSARRLAKHYWPGPLTLVLPCGHRFAPGVASTDGSVGVRCSAHPLASAFARRLRAEGLGPVTATSLNASGEPPARRLCDATQCCETGGAAPPLLLAVDGAEAGGEEPSTVLDLAGREARVLREGAIPSAHLSPFLEENKSA